jgi:hypothetical protein
MITSSSFVFGNSNKRFTILNIYDDNIDHFSKEVKPEITKEENQKNKCCIIS